MLWKCLSSHNTIGFRTQTLYPFRLEPCTCYWSQTPDTSLPLNSCVRLLECCSQNRSLPQGKLLHANIIQSGFIPAENSWLSNKLINIYNNCGSLIDARRIFNQMPGGHRDPRPWTLVISAYSRHGFLHQALALFRQIPLFCRNEFIFSCSLKACAKLADFQTGINIHCDIIRSGFDNHAFVQSALVDMYAKCGRVEDARQVFDKMSQRDVVAWTAMVFGYARNGRVDEALGLFGQMPERNGVSWCAMIAGCAQNGRNTEVLQLFKQMRKVGSMMKPEPEMFACVLSVLGRLMDVLGGMEIHEEVVRIGLRFDVVVANALVDMYGKCGRVEDARQVFDEMPQRDVVSWTSMVAGYAQNGVGEQAVKLLREMEVTGLKPNAKTFASVLPGCAHVGDLGSGREIHGKVIRSGFDLNEFVGSGLVDMYVKCGRLQKARIVFEKMRQRDVVAWTAMIGGYAQNGSKEEVMVLFQEMQLQGVLANSKTFATLLSACAKLASLDGTDVIHGNIIKRGLNDVVLVINTLIDAYAKCGCIASSSKLFENMGYPDVVSWTAMISAYAQNGLGEEAVKLFREMQLTHTKPNAKTFASVIPAYANMAALEEGMEVHVEIIRNGLQSDLFVANGLIDMYAKCGSIEKACNLFYNLDVSNVVSWNTMISGFSINGCSKEALSLFEEMQSFGRSPNHVTFLCVLSTCCHAGLVEEGYKYFNSMSECYHVIPAMEHYSCMVDLLGRAGRLEEAQEFINKMPIKPDVNVWRCLLAACRLYNNLDLGKHVAERLFQLGPTSATDYLLLSKIYAAAGKWEDAEKYMQNMVKHRELVKMPGCSWIEVNKKMHAFLMGEIPFTNGANIL